MPGWGAMQVSHAAECLGFVLRPVASEQCGLKPWAKLERRAALRAGLGLGLHHTTVADNVFMANLLAFLLQLEPLPSNWQTTDQISSRSWYQARRTGSFPRICMPSVNHWACRRASRAWRRCQWPPVSGGTAPEGWIKRSAFWVATIADAPCARYNRPCSACPKREGWRSFFCMPSLQMPTATRISTCSCGCSPVVHCQH
jgi:hypothetical protein